MDCCNNGLDQLFTDDVSRRDADRYRKRGLSKRARLLTSAIEANTRLSNSTVLEVGVGAGGVLVELLRRGMRYGVGVDAVPSQIAAARLLARDFNVADRASFVVANFAEMDGGDEVDVVIMDRVVCCFPDWQILIERCADRTRRIGALTYPRGVWWMHVAAFFMNSWQKMRGQQFRFHIHSPAAMHAALAARGLTPHVTGHYFGWEILIAKRV